LGLTRGGSELEITVSVNERLTDEYGPAATDIYFGGATAKLHTCLAEHTISLLGELIPGSTVVGGSVLHLGGTVGSEITGYPLVITPVDENDPVGSVTLHKAFPLPAGKITYKAGRERLVPVVFYGTIDTTKDDGQRLVKWAASADTTAPGIDGSTPNNGETGVSRTITVDIQFSEQVGPITDENFILLDETNDTVVACTLDTDDVSESEFHVTIDPDNTLAAAAVHRVIMAGVRDNSGNLMDISTRKFTTGS